MSSFLISAAALLLVALAAIVFPLLRTRTTKSINESASLSLIVLREQLKELESERSSGTLDQNQYSKERSEIERRAIEDGRTDPLPGAATVTNRRTGLGAALGLAIIAVSIPLYLLLGSPETIEGLPAHGNPQQSSHSVTPQQILAMVERLADRLQKNPEDGEGWLMLARSYNALGRYPEAAAAFGRATGLLQPDAQLLSDYADTLAMAQGRRLQGEPEKIISLALTVDPRNVKALALSGSAAFERNDYARAIREWRKVLDVVPADSNVAQSIRSSIADAENRSGGKPADAKVAAAKSGASIRGTVSLDSNLKDKAKDSDIVFIFARATSGPRMPLAITRLRVADLPSRFTLDDSMGMGAGPKLSDHAQVIVGARISKSGNATPQAGDLEGYSEPVATKSDSIRIIINKSVQ
jgi:cytochrome c-type biogenesis protein CcmH